MKKKWIVIPSVLVLAVAGAFAATPPGRSLWARHLGPKVAVSPALRQQTIDTLVAGLNEHYLFPEKAKEIEALLRKHQREGKYDGIADGEGLARQLKQDIDSVAHDKHMEVVFEPGEVPPDPVGPPPRTREEWERNAPLPLRLYARVSSLGVDKVERLGSNIGYLELSQLPPHFIVAGKYADAMNRLADTDGLILDLRNNGGGFPDTVGLLISYFVDGRTRLNDRVDRNAKVVEQRWTTDTLDGKRYGGKKPVVILTSADTFSGAEDLAYTMQAMKRATIVGERTRGAAHAPRPYRLGDHFLAFIPNERPVNPITHADWEGIGVVPDIAAKRDEALEVAKNVLQRRIQEAVPVVAAQR